MSIFIFIMLYILAGLIFVKALHLLGTSKWYHYVKWMYVFVLDGFTQKNLNSTVVVLTVVGYPWCLVMILVSFVGKVLFDIIYWLYVILFTRWLYNFLTSKRDISLIKK